MRFWDARRIVVQRRYLSHRVHVCLHGIACVRVCIDTCVYCMHVHASGTCTWGWHLGLGTHGYPTDLRLRALDPRVPSSYARVFISGVVLYACACECARDLNRHDRACRARQHVCTHKGGTSSVSPWHVFGHVHRVCKHEWTCVQTCV